MPEAAVPRDVPHLEMIESMMQCAFELGRAATEIAKRAADTKLFLAASAEFRHCFFSVRMGIRLAQTLRLNPARAALAAEAPERERPEAVDALERERGDIAEHEREREGDYEPVSLAKFLKTLRGVAASAEQRRDELPAPVRETTLPRLHDLLAQATAPPDCGARRSAPSGVTVLARSSPVPATRSRLFASTIIPGLPPLRPTVSRRPDSS